jgi:hypothetical protein
MVLCGPRTFLWLNAGCIRWAWMLCSSRPRFGGLCAAYTCDASVDGVGNFNVYEM